MPDHTLPDLRQMIVEHRRKEAAAALQFAAARLTEVKALAGVNGDDQAVAMAKEADTLAERCLTGAGRKAVPAEAGGTEAAGS